MPPPPIHAIHTQNEGILTKNKGFRICCCPGESLPCYYHADPCGDDCPTGADNVYVFCEQAPEGDEIFAFEGACYVVDGSTEYDALPDGGVEAPIEATFESCEICCGINEGDEDCNDCKPDNLTGQPCDPTVDTIGVNLSELATGDWCEHDSWSDEDFTLQPIQASPATWWWTGSRPGLSGIYNITKVTVECYYGAWVVTVDGDWPGFGYLKWAMVGAQHICPFGEYYNNIASIACVGDGFVAGNLMVE